MSKYSRIVFRHVYLPITLMFRGSDNWLNALSTGNE